MISQLFYDLKNQSDITEIATTIVWLFSTNWSKVHTPV